MTVSVSSLPALRSPHITMADRTIGAGLVLPVPLSR
jgi:hypothetical protein